jgi:hypothetical protein
VRFAPRTAAISLFGLQRPPLVRVVVISNLRDHRAVGGFDRVQFVIAAALVAFERGRLGEPLPSDASQPKGSGVFCWLGRANGPYHQFVGALLVQIGFLAHHGENPRSL